jgi:Raf kinase inhibitor-like YbhB/YbcL family protein
MSLCDGEPMPVRFVRDGANVSPSLAWRGLPSGTEEIAITCIDPDAPREKPFVHWVIYGIPADRSILPEGNEAIGIEGRNDWGQLGYDGPQPPRGHGVHHYHFAVHALDAKLRLREGAGLEELQRAMAGHVLAQAELVATFER